MVRTHPTRKIAKIALPLMLAACAPISQAAMMNYTFSGFVTNLSAATPNGVQTGDAVSYTIAVDFDQNGFTLSNSGVVTTQADFVGCSNFIRGVCIGYYYNLDHFYAEYVSGSEIPNVVSGYGSSLFYGRSESAIDPNVAHAKGSLNVSNWLTISSDQKTVQQWQTGDMFEVTDQWLINLTNYYYPRHATIPEYGNLSASVELVGISAVPLPASIWLFTGTLGVFGFLKRKQKIG